MTHSCMIIDPFLYVAENSNGAVVGLIVVKQPISDKVSSYQVGPLYADNIEIASYLLHYVCTSFISKGLLARQEISLVYPEQNNRNAAVLVDKLGGTHASDFIRMFTAKPPEYSIEHVYSVSYLM